VGERLRAGLEGTDWKVRSTLAMRGALVVCGSGQKERGHDGSCPLSESGEGGLAAAAGDEADHA
jgi:hypothetical protein